MSNVLTQNSLGGIGDKDVENQLITHSNLQFDSNSRIIYDAISNINFSLSLVENFTKLTLAKIFINNNEHKETESQSAIANHVFPEKNLNCKSYATIIFDLSNSNLLNNKTILLALHEVMHEKLASSNVEYVISVTIEEYAATTLEFYSKMGIITEVSKVLDPAIVILAKINNPRKYFSNNIEYFFSEDRDLLEQYYQLRQEIYKEEIGSDFPAGRDIYDQYCDHLLMVENNRVVGGCRIVRNNIYNLPLEEPEKGFSLNTLLPNLNLYNSSYAEVSRLVIKKEFRDRVHSQNMSQLIYAKAFERKYKYVFAVSDILQSRNVLILARRMGLKAEILKDITVPTKPVKEGLTIMLSVIYLTPQGGKNCNFICNN